MAVVSCWTKWSLDLHDALHGFMSGRGMGTTTLEEKLIQKLA